MAGFYDLKQGFVILPRMSMYNEKEDRPYVIQDTSIPTGLLWHSHPFSSKIKNAFPSIEDLDVAFKFPDLIHMLLTIKEMYVYAALRPCR